MQALDESTSSTLSNSSSQAEDILTLAIPLTSIGSAGLGISVKGKHTDNENQDNGIFVKSVLKGGAAAKVSSLYVVTVVLEKPQNCYSQTNNQLPFSFCFM